MSSPNLPHAIEEELSPATEAALVAAEADRLRAMHDAKALVEEWAEEDAATYLAKYGAAAAISQT